MRIGYFGGSFDPPHRGHLAVALAARDRFGLDRVLLAPTASQPLKPHGPAASFADRLRMTELLCAGEPGLEASAIDGPQPDGTPNYTVDTLRRLGIQSSSRPSVAEGLSGFHSRRESVSPAADSTHPQLFAIAGADAFLGLPQWREPDQLLALAEWIVVSRPGFPLAHIAQLALTPVQRTRVHLVDGIAEAATATALRTRLLAGDDCHDLLPAPIASYIQQNGLYRASEAVVRPY